MEGAGGVGWFHSGCTVGVCQSRLMGAACSNIRLQAWRPEISFPIMPSDQQIRGVPDTQNEGQPLLNDRFVTQPPGHCLCVVVWPLCLCKCLCFDVKCLSNLCYDPFRASHNIK